MRSREQEQYHRLLTDFLKNCDCRPRLSDAPNSDSDFDEQAAVNHARYVAGLSDEIRLEICDAARRALARLEDGAFGRCVECGGMISPRRLMAVPWAERCVRCQAEREQSTGLRKVA